MEKIKEFIKKLNEYGIPLPLLRIDGAPSLTANMVVISFITCIVGQFAKLTKVLGDIDMTQANYLLVICLANYAHKRMVVNKDKTVTIEEKDKKDS